MAVSTTVGNVKKLYNLVFLQKSRKQIGKAICKVVNVMEILYFYEYMFRSTKKFRPILTL